MRLERLNAMRDAGARLLARDRLGRDVFRRAAPEGLRTVRKAQWQAEIYDLIAAYGQINARNRPVFHVVHERPVMTLDAALERVSRLLGVQVDWATIESFLPDTLDGAFRKSALASSFVAALELARMGKAELRQQSRVRAALFEGDRVIEPDDLTRAVEAVLFAADEPLTVEAIRAHVGAEADVRAALDALGRALCRARNRTRQSRRSLAFPDRGRHGALAPPRARGSAQTEPRGDRDAGDHRLSRACHARRDRGDSRGADFEGHARRSDGGGLGAARWTEGKPRAGR